MRETVQVPIVISSDLFRLTGNHLWQQNTSVLRKFCPAMPLRAAYWFLMQRYKEVESFV